jgi:hypothetical protein
MFRRGPGASAIDDEREQLRQAREQAAIELEAMKRELAERVRAVAEREQELSAALAAAGGRHPPKALPERPPQAVAEASEAERRRIEERLAELREAEQQFLRTQDELAARSEALAARERELAERERKARPADQTGLARTGHLNASLPHREPPAPASPAPTTFADGLESLRRRGTRGRSS